MKSEDKQIKPHQLLELKMNHMKTILERSKVGNITPQNQKKFNYILHKENQCVQCKSLKIVLFFMQNVLF